MTDELPTSQRRQFLFAQFVSLAAILLFLLAVDALTPTLFLFGAVVALLVVSEATSLTGVRPRWRRRLRWVLVVGVVLLTAVLVHELQDTVTVLFLAV